MVRDCRPDDIGISVSYPLPGTPFYERVKAQLGDKQNWVDSNDLALMYPAAYPPGFYRVLHAVVHAEFRSRRLFAGRSLRERAAAIYHTVRLPLLRRRLDRLASQKPSSPIVVLRPVLTQQAAAIPTEQP